MRRCQEALEQCLPLDDERAAEVRVWLAMLIRSHVDHTLDDLRLSGWQGLRYLCRVVVAELAGRPHPPGLEHPLPRRLEGPAASLHTWLDGITLHAVSVPELLTPEEVRRELRRELRRIQGSIAA